MEKSPETQKEKDNKEIPRKIRYTHEWISQIVVNIKHIKEEKNKRNKEKKRKYTNK